MQWRFGTVAVAAALFSLTPPALAAPTPWVGTANYAAGPNGDGAEGDLVGPFDTYDFGLGPVLIPGGQGAMVEGDTLTGYFQSFVTRHEDRSGGGGTVSAPHMKTSKGVGAGYEVTLAGTFEETITAVIPGVVTTFNITGGSAKLYLDATPDFDFATDSGFMDSGAILSATVVGGTGSITSADNSGHTTLDIRVDSFDPAVYAPDTITGGSSIFTLQIGTPADIPFLANISSVQGQVYDSNTDLLIAADGNLSLSVPEPVSCLLVGSAVVGLVVLRRRA